jgi:4-amino-4-deoxy-L-arabinose transferase-like glycosyltransferase
MCSSPVTKCSHTWKVKLHTARSRPLTCSSCEKEVFVYRPISSLLSYIYAAAFVFGSFPYWGRYGTTVLLGTYLACIVFFYVVLYAEWATQEPKMRTEEMRSSDAISGKILFVLGVGVIAAIAYVLLHT